MGQKHEYTVLLNIVIILFIYNASSIKASAGGLQNITVRVRENYGILRFIFQV